MNLTNKVSSLTFIVFGIILFSILSQNVHAAGNQTCYATIQAVPFNCTGTIISDITTGCRTIICANGASNLTVQACDKQVNSPTPQYFEIYKQAQSGPQLTICAIDGTCISNNGYAQSSPYPLSTCNQSTASNATTTYPPYPTTPTWIEPSGGSILVDTIDFHIQINPLTLAPNETHVSSDFEIWDANTSQRVWRAINSTQILIHIHNANGIFEGNLAGQNQLLPDHDYYVRARVYVMLANGTVAQSNWTEQRYFHTQPATNYSASPYLWTARLGYTVDLVASNISVPVNVQVAPTNLYQNLPTAKRPLLYVTQLYGYVGVVRNDGSYGVYANNLLNFQSFGSLPGSGETGVDGLYVDPSGDLFVSLVYAAPQSLTGFYGKVVRFATNASGDGYTSSTIILQSIPVAPSHHVHTITRGPDGKLYLQTGDADAPEAVGQHNLLSGKILRFNDDGSVPSDNPYPGSYVYASGFRNPFGGAWRPGTNELWVTNNGPDQDDGIYRVHAGDQEGWCCNTSYNTWYHWHKTVAPVAAAFNTGNNSFSNDTIGSYFVGLSGATYHPGPINGTKQIDEFKLNPDGSLRSVSPLVVYTGPGYGDPIGIAFGDAGLYFTDIYGEAGFVGVAQTRGNVYLVHPGNQSANATNTTTNSTNISSQFSATLGSAAWYPQGLNMIWVCNGLYGSGNYTYDFQFGDGHQQLGTSSNNAYHAYPANGTYNASCTVHDMSSFQNASTATTLVLGTGSGAQNATNTTNSTGTNSTNTNNTNNTGLTFPQVLVRVVNANPENMTYTFRCSENPESGFVRDWYIHPNENDTAEATFLDQPAGADITYTFQKRSYYHIGCLVVNATNTSQLYRGDIHIDLRNATDNPDLIPLAVSPMQVTLQCAYAGNYSVQWFVSTYAFSGGSEPTVRIALNTSNKTITYSPPTPGLFDPRCDVHDLNTGTTITANAAIEFFNNTSPYIADQRGIDINNNFAPFNFSAWIAAHNVTIMNDTSTINSTNATNMTFCYARVQSMPAVCNGGTVIRDVIGGCRTLVCINGTSNLTVMACNKPGDNAPQYFEMYKQASSGTGIQLCLGTTCISNGGYAKSGNYPICINTVVNGTGNATNQTNSTGNQTNITQNISFTSVTPISSTLNIAEPNNQTFSISVNNPSVLPTSASWILNGANQTSSFNINTFTFLGNYTTAGVWNITAIVTSSQNTISNTWLLTVNDTVQTNGTGNQTNTTNATIAASLGIAQWYPQGRNYIFICSATGFTPTNYDWYFGDGHKQLNSASNNVYHTYAAAGPYTVNCTAKNATASTNANLNITVA